MPWKCCVGSCRSGYDAVKHSDENATLEKNSVFAFPKDMENQQKWLKALPNIVSIVTPYIGICRNHLPKDAKMKAMPGGVCAPVEPQSIFSNVPLQYLSFLRVIHQSSRTTYKCLSSCKLIGFVKFRD